MFEWRRSGNTNDDVGHKGGGNKRLIYGMSADAKTDLKNIQFPNRSAFVFGSETNGMKTLVEKNCDELVKIKINKEVESLNISNAVSITLAIANKY